MGRSPESGEVKATVSQDCTIALQPGQQSETLCQKKMKFNLKKENCFVKLIFQSKPRFFRYRECSPLVRFVSSKRINSSFLFF